jgi:hypothetical protein
VAGPGAFRRGIRQINSHQALKSTSTPVPSLRDSGEWGGLGGAESWYGGNIEARCDQAWPSVVIANRDGAVEIKLIKEAQAACSSIQVGDYLEADGEKQHEGLYYADSVGVKPR